MQVSRRSWHYRLHVMVFTIFNLEFYGPLAYLDGRRDEHHPKSLCTYFWSTVSLLFLMIVLLPFVVIVLILFLIGVGTIEGIRWIKRQYRGVRPAKEKPEEPPKPAKEPGLVRSFAKAHKSKVCPLIDIVD